ncbi:MAG: hypothetical protein NVSMB49_19620 [Ktedonobacteraceae bacterium]
MSYLRHIRQYILPRLGLVFVIMLLVPAVASAHEKWFTDSRPYPPQFGLIFTLPVLGMIGLSLLGIGVLALLRHLVGGDNRFPQIGFLRYYDRSNQVILGVQTAISLIAVAVTLHIFAPNLYGGFNALGFILAGIEVFVAFSFISGVLTRVGAIALIVLFLFSFFLYPAWAVLEQTVYIGIALYLLIMGRGLVRPGLHREPLSYFARYWRIAPLLLRMGVGISIVVLAFTEKLADPGLALAFLKTHPNFNVAQLIGLTWFTNERFILAAGAVELTIGLALMSGILPKIVIFGMFVPFNLTLPFLPPSELLGHLPIFAVMYTLLFLPPINDQVIDGTSVKEHPQVEIPPRVEAQVLRS